MNKRLSVVICAILLFACGGQIDQPGRFADLVLRDGNVLAVDENFPKARGYIFNTLAKTGTVPTNGTDPPVDEISPIGSFY